MFRSYARAGVIASALFGFAGASQAADLDYGAREQNLEPYAPYYYHRDVPKQGQYYEEKYVERGYSEARPIEPRYAEPPYREKYDSRDVPRRYSNYDERDPRNDQRACLSKGDIRYRLKEHGWQDFQDVEFRGDTAVVTARRPDGMLYKLEVDRCSGVIVQARLLDEGRGWRQGSRQGFTY